MAEYKIIINGRFPGINEYTSACRTHKQKGGALKKNSQNEIQWQLSGQCKKLNIAKPVHLNYNFFEKDKRRDLDNISGFFHKIFQDALVQCGILKNDNWHCITGFSDAFYVDAKRPRIEIIIKEVER